MDELDQLWFKHFDRRASPIERRLLVALHRSVGAEDPIFPVLMMLVRILYETLGSTEQAVLQRGPELNARMQTLSVGLDDISTKIGELVDQLTKLSAVSSRLAETHQRMDRIQALQSRWVVMPDWLKISLTAGATIVAILAGALAFAIAT